MTTTENEDYLTRITESYCENADRYSLAETEIGRELRNYFRLFGIPQSVDRSASHHDLCKKLADERERFVAKYHDFCARRNSIVGRQTFDQLVTTGVVVPHLFGKFSPNDEIAQAIRANAPPETRRRLFWGNGLSNGLYAGYIERKVSFDPVQGHHYAYYPGNTGSSGLSLDWGQRDRARAYARRKQMESLFPGKVRIIENYEDLVDAARGLEERGHSAAIDAIEAFTRGCDRHGIPAGFNIKETYDKIRSGDPAVLREMVAAFPTPIPQSSSGTLASGEQAMRQLGFVERVTRSFGTVGTVGKIAKGTGVAAGFAALIDGSRRAWTAVEVDAETGEARRNWTKTVTGVSEAALGAGLAGVAAVATAKNGGRG